jgi:ABC-type uncharacterized transport system substrate-binding protein
MTARPVGFLHPGSQAQFSDFVDSFNQALSSNLAGGDTPAYNCKWGNGLGGTAYGDAQALISAKVQVIVALGGAFTAAAAVAATGAAGSTVPVVFSSGGDLTDLVTLGLSASNATGVVMGTTDSVTTRVTALRQVFSTPPEIADFVRYGTGVYHEERQKATANNLYLVDAFQHLNGGTIDFVNMFADAKNKGATAVVVCADPTFTHQRQALITAANMPVAYPFKAYVTDGGFMSVGPDLVDVYTQVGIMAAQILNASPGTKLPSIYNFVSDSLPVWINLTTANNLRAAGALLLSNNDLTTIATQSGGGVITTTGKPSGRSRRPY